MSLLGQSLIYPNIVQRSFTTRFPYDPIAASNPIEGPFPLPFTFCKGKQTKITLTRINAGTIAYSCEFQVSGGYGSPYYGGADKANFVSYLVDSAVQTTPNPGTLLTVAWTNYPLNNITLTTTDGAVDRVFLFSFNASKTVQPVVRMTAGDALGANDVIVITCSQGVEVLG